MVVRSVSTVRRGALSIEDGETMRAAADSALTLRIPVVLVLASSGADVSDGVASLHGWGRAARALSRCSGVVPVMVVVTGPALSGPALLLGLADLVVMTSDAYRLRVGSGHGRGVHRSPHRHPPAGRHRHARPLERPVRHRGRLRGGRAGPRGPPAGPAPGPSGRAASPGRDRGRAEHAGRRAPRDHSGPDHQLLRRAPGGWPPWPTTTT